MPLSENVTIVLVILLPITPIIVSENKHGLSFDLLPNSTRPFTIKLLRSICSGQPNEYVRILECRVKVARGAATTATFHVTALKRIDTLLGKFTVMYRYTSSYKPFLMATEVDVCKFLDRRLRERDQVAEFLYQAIVDYLPDIRSCPIPAGNYSVVDFAPEESKMPNYLPSGEFRLDSRFYNAQNMTVLIHQFYFLVRAKGVMDLSIG